MECSFEINVVEPREGDMMFRPYIEFRLIQLNATPKCLNNAEIDFQVKQLHENVEKLRKKAKKGLKDALDRHGALLEKRNEK